MVNWFHTSSFIHADVCGSFGCHFSNAGLAVTQCTPAEHLNTSERSYPLRTIVTDFAFLRTRPLSPVSSTSHSSILTAYFFHGSPIMKSSLQGEQYKISIFITGRKRTNRESYNYYINLAKVAYDGNADKNPGRRG